LATSPRGNYLFLCEADIAAAVVPAGAMGEASTKKCG
jgi:hypothetical protein